jgi:membrane protease YdiL (CAAX protease family)
MIILAFQLVKLIDYSKNEKMTFCELINYKKGNTKIFDILLLSIVSIIIGIGGIYIAGYLCFKEIPYFPTMLISPLPIPLAIIIALTLPFTTTIAEDGLYLGIGVNRIKNKYFAVLIPVFFYTVQHSFLPLLLDTKFMLYRFIAFLPLTIIFCWFYRRKRNPVPLMIGHFILNMATVAQILLFSIFPEIYVEMVNI